MTERAAKRTPRMTRRRALVVGAAAMSLAVSAQYGRFAVGDEFEKHVAGVLGLSSRAARRLLIAARRRLGDADYDLRAAAFLGATTFPGTSLIPEGTRREAVDSLLIPMIETSEENLVAIGLRAQASGVGVCAGLLSP